MENPHAGEKVSLTNIGHSGRIEWVPSQRTADLAMVRSLLLPGTRSDEFAAGALRRGVKLLVGDARRRRFRGLDAPGTGQRAVD